MKKMILFSLTVIMCSTATTTKAMQISTESSPSLILISKKSSQKLETIENDYIKLHKAIQTRYCKERDPYSRPSDLITTLCRDKSIKTKLIIPNLLFTPEDMKFLDEEFKEISRQYSIPYAWSTALIIIRKKLASTCDNLRKRELIRSGARVALKQDPAFSQSSKLPSLFDECNDTVAYDLDDLEQEEKNGIFQAIKGYKNILAQNKLGTQF